MCARSGNADAISRFVLIGDHKQLPAVVQQTEAESRVTEPELLSIGLTDCRRSLFERLLSSFKTVDGYDCRYVYMLTRQGRMHRDIADFPNEAFYGGRLEWCRCRISWRQTQPARRPTASADCCNCAGWHLWHRRSQKCRFQQRPIRWRPT